MSKNEVRTEREKLRESRVGYELKPVETVGSLIYYANDTIKAFERYLVLFRQAVDRSDAHFAELRHHLGGRGASKV